MAYNKGRDALEVPKSSTVDTGVKRGMSTSDNLEGSTVRTPLSVAQQALTRLTNCNWIQIADEIWSVGQNTDEELSELANMMVTKGLQSPDNIQNFSEMFVRIMYSLAPDVMWCLRWAFFDATSHAFQTLLKSDSTADSRVLPGGARLEVAAKMSAMMDFLGQLFICNVFTERILHACLQDLLRQPSDLRIEAAAYLLHITEPVMEHNLHVITGQPSGLQGCLYLRHYYHRIEYWCLAGQMDAAVCKWIMDAVVRPRRIWEQQQMKTVVPITACSAMYGRPAAPRTAPICPQGMCAMEFTPTIAKVKGISEKAHAAQISKGRKREQPSSPGTPSPTSVKATLQQPTGQAGTHPVPPQWSLGDFACGQQRPSPVGASSMSSQHASETCSATADEKTSHAPIHPAVSFCAQSVVSHSSAQQRSKSAVQDSVQDAPPQYCIADFGMGKPVPGRVQTPSMTSIQHASRPGAKPPPQASASATASDIHTDPMRQVAANQFSLADDFPSLDTLRQTEQPAAKKSTRHSPIAHGPSAHTHASSKKSANDKSADAANKTSSTSLRAADPQVIAQATKATSAPDKGSSASVHGSTAATNGSTAATNGSTAATNGSTAATNGSTAATNGSTAATKGATSVAADAALPTKHATAAANISTEAALSSKSATASGKAAKAPAKDTTSGVVSTTAPVKDATAPVKGATAPIEGATAPDEGATASDEGATAPVEDAAAPIKGSTAPVKGVTLKDARGARERNTQASALNIASTSSATPANAFLNAPAANTSSTSLNLPDPNASPFYGSDSSDDFHSTSSDAVELRSSRLSPHGSPSQASTSSYTTARSQTSSNDQASYNHSQSACMTSTAAAPAAVSSSSQGVKQAGMAPQKVPLPPAEQQHNANAERGQVSQVGQHSSQPPVRFQIAHVEPEQPAQAERHYKGSPVPTPFPSLSLSKR